MNSTDIKQGQTITYCGETFTASTVRFDHVADVVMVGVEGSYPRSITLGHDVELVEPVTVTAVTKTSKGHRVELSNGASFNVGARYSHIVLMQSGGWNPAAHDSSLWCASRHSTFAAASKAAADRRENSPTVVELGSFAELVDSLVEQAATTTCDNADVEHPGFPCAHPVSVCETRGEHTWTNGACVDCGTTSSVPVGVEQGTIIQRADRATVARLHGADVAAYVADSYPAALPLLADGWTVDAALAHVDGACDWLVCTGDHSDRNGEPVMAEQRIREALVAQGWADVQIDATLAAYAADRA